MEEFQGKLVDLVNMKLHEVARVKPSENVHLSYVIIKVSGGWVYTLTNLVSGRMNSVYVPDTIDINFNSLNETLENYLPR
jgi:hypothetical protein